MVSSEIETVRSRHFIESALGGGGRVGEWGGGEVSREEKVHQRWLKTSSVSIGRNNSSKSVRINFFDLLSREKRKFIFFLSSSNFSPKTQKPHFFLGRKKLSRSKLIFCVHQFFRFHDWLSPQRILDCGSSSLRTTSASGSPWTLIPSSWLMVRSCWAAAESPEFEWSRRPRVATVLPKPQARRMVTAQCRLQQQAQV